MTKDDNAKTVAKYAQSSAKSIADLMDSFNGLEKSLGDYTPASIDEVTQINNLRDLIKKERGFLVMLLLATNVLTIAFGGEVQIPETPLEP